MAAHPLVALRTATGLSQSAYAQLIARVHAELGHGQMAARREKVSRWESGRITPELSAQLAIARIHGVDRDIVLRLGWPQWLPGATGDHALSGQPWNPQAAIGVTRATAEATWDCGPTLIITGPSLAGQIRGAVQALTDPRPPARDGPASPPRHSPGPRPASAPSKNSKPAAPCTRAPSTWLPAPSTDSSATC
ncbi:hypothetical protein ACIPYS_39540 [Kitasatospora sp. NPDC089913]|uniref:hypothetical protein n=1 Tax=Kitasatospora sp. NPDC089913 TaxID=3364080 RepID=UPI00380A95AB